MIKQIGSKAVVIRSRDDYFLLTVGKYILICDKDSLKVTCNGETLRIFLNSGMETTIRDNSIIVGEIGILVLENYLVVKGEYFILNPNVRRYIMTLIQERLLQVINEHIIALYTNNDKKAKTLEIQRDLLIELYNKELRRKYYDKTDRI